MRMIRITACLTAAFAVSAIGAGSASAAIEYDSNIHPAQTLSSAINTQGFNGGGVIIACPTLTANTGEEIGKVPAAEAKNPTSNSPTLVTHPIYGGKNAAEECRATIGASSFEVEVRTRGCNFVTHAAKPNPVAETAGFPKTGEVDIKCGPGVAGIENVFLNLAGCTITVFPQTLKGLEYKNEPKTGNETESEVTTASEVKGIKSKATSTCGIVAGTNEFEAEYREGHIETGGLKTATIEPADGKHTAKSVGKAVKPIELTGEVTNGSNTIKGLSSTTGILVGARVGGAKIAAGATVKTVGATEVEIEDKNPGGACPIPPATGCPVEGTFAPVKEIVKFSSTEPIAGAVAVNERHWYSQGVGLVKQAGGSGAEGMDTLSWGTITLKGTAAIGTETVCQHEAAGDLYNPAGSEFASINNAAGEAEAGKLKVDAWQAYDCEGGECTTKAAKETMESEGLSAFGEWEGNLVPGSKVAGVADKPAELVIGNEGGAEATQIKFHVVCPTFFDVKATGKLTPGFESGTTKGSVPAIVTFSPAPQAELTVTGGSKASFTGKLKWMGFEGGEFISAKAP